MLRSNSVKIRYAFIAFIGMTAEAQIALYRLKYQSSIADRMYLYCIILCIERLY